MKKFSLTLAAAALAAVLVGCSSPKHEPAELVSFTPAINVSEVWSVSMPNADGFLVPGLFDESVWVAGGKELARLDARTGNKEWTVSFDSPVVGGVGTDGYNTAVGLENGELIVLNAEGKEDWKSKLTSELAGPPVITNGLVIVRTKDMRVSAFEASSGEQQWTFQRNQPALTVRVPISMTARDNFLFVGQPNGNVVILDVNNGRPVFEFPVAQAKGITEVERLIDVVGASVLNADMLCAAAYQGAVTCINSTNGQMMWTQNVDAIAGPAVDEDNVYVVDVTGVVRAYYRESGELRWENKTMTYRGLSAPVIMPGTVAVGDNEGYVHLLSPRTGEEIARTRLSGPIVTKAQSFSAGAIFQTSKGDVAYLATR